MASNNNSPEFDSGTGKVETEEPGAASMASSGSGSGSGSGSVTPTPANTAAAAMRSTSQQRQASQSTPAPPLRKQRSSNLAPTTSSPSAGASPITSRNTSPIRKDSRPQSLTNPISTQPSAAAIQRALSAANVPQLPSPGPVTDAVSRLPRASKSAGGTISGETTPSWPSSPRLKSPPPSTSISRRGSATAQKKVDTALPAAPSISVQSPSVQTSTPSPKANNEETRRSEQQLQTPAKGPSRGPSGKSVLDTVQEDAADSIAEPPAATQAAADLKPLTKIADDGKAAKRDGSDGDKNAQPTESGSESAGSKIDAKRGRRQSLTQQNNKSTSRPTNASKGSYTPLSSAKSRQAEGKANMTVETETVQSIPTSSLNAGERPGRTENSGSVRLKPSIETIRPKKERKKPTQKARSINQGTGESPKSRSHLLLSRNSFEDESYDSVATTSYASSAEDVLRFGSPQQRRSQSSRCRQLVSSVAPTKHIRTFSDRYLRKASSKADIFEARVASAVADEENSSASDETFVYESNPPEPQRPRRHHSRTPSVTSAHSIADQQRGIRSLGDVIDERRVGGKRSMKFASNPYNDTDSPESKNGTVRSHQARHFGKFGRGGSHNSGVYDPDSPFTQASKLRVNHLNSRGSRPNSPRSPQSVQQQQRPAGGLFTRKNEQSFDFDAEGADDERTPLVGTVRTPRGTRYLRRPNSASIGSIDEYYGVRQQPRYSRFCGCVLGVCVLAAVILIAIGFLVMSNRPLYDVQIRRIQNVLASEQELMLDLLVGATNPNPLGIVVTDMDVNVFAKSTHVGTSRTLTQLTTSESRSRRRRSWITEESLAKDKYPNSWEDMSGHWHSPTRGIDDGTDPDEDLEGDAQTMLLGRVSKFDQPLVFEGSPIKRHSHFSVGEMRLTAPGNKTEVRGSERWEKVMQHPFELIVRGVLKYQLPVSARMQTVTVGASVQVHPEDGIDEEGRMRVTPIKHDEDWHWIDEDDLLDDLLPPVDARIAEEVEED